MYNHYQKAKEEGRLCQRCSWFVSKKRWKRGERLCEGCEDGLKGVSGPLADRNVKGILLDEPVDFTGEHF